MCMDDRSWYARQARLAIFIVVAPLQFLNMGCSSQSAPTAATNAPAQQADEQTAATSSNPPSGNSISKDWSQPTSLRPSKASSYNQPRSANQQTRTEHAVTEQAVTDQAVTEQAVTKRSYSEQSAIALPLAPPRVSAFSHPEQPIAKLVNFVEVFYATDRLPTVALLPSTWRTFAPAAVVWMIGGALLIGFSLSKRFNTFWLLACGLAVCLGVTVLHESIIRWQQYSRLARNAETRFSADRDSGARDYPLHLGTARVSLPASHRPGNYEQPQLLRFEFVESADKHIVLHSLQEQPSSQAWFDELSSVARTASRDDAVVFIHGYNVRFVDALKRTAQLACDLELKGPAICYSWPSRGDLAGYTADEASVSWSAPHFQQLLLDLRARTGCRRVQVIAHSMGNRALLQAIERIDVAQRSKNPSQGHLDEQGPTKLIDRLVMAAPDVDLGEFSSRYVEPLQHVAQHTTLYFSDSDRALLLSARIHGAPRLGLLRDHLQAFAGIESIYVGSQSSLSLGHSYYADDPAVIEDLKVLLSEGRTASSRELLRAATSNKGISFWQIDRALQAARPATTLR